MTTADKISVLLDLERCALGPPEWDLVSTAVTYVTTAGIDINEWDNYCEVYGYDVTTWEGFDILRDIRELHTASRSRPTSRTPPGSRSSPARTPPTPTG